MILFRPSSSEGCLTISIHHRFVWMSSSLKEPFRVRGWVSSRALQRSCYQDTPAFLTTSPALEMTGLSPVSFMRCLARCDFGVCKEQGHIHQNMINSDY